MKYLTESLRIEILMIWYGNRYRKQLKVAQLFHQMHPELPLISQGTVFKTEAQFRELGRVKRSSVPDDTKIDVLLSIEENPRATLRQNAFEHDFSYTAVLNCLKRKKLHP